MLKEILPALCLSCFNESDSFAYVFDFLGSGVRDSDVKSFFKFHDELYSVKRVSTEVFAKFSSFNYFSFVNTKLFYDNFFYAICNFRHNVCFNISC